jgi:thioredoxin
MASELDDENFKKNIKQGKAVVDFYADWCGPCQMMKPVFDKISKEVRGVSFFKVNVDNNPEAATMYAVRSIPTTVFLKDGREVDRVLGVLYEDEFKKKIMSVLK